jgi:Zn-dependent protease
MLGYYVWLRSGWAKPVEFNEQNLRNPKTDVLKIAGRTEFALLAMILSVIYAILFTAGYINPYPVTDEIFIYGIFINWGLFVFNLIPILPLMVHIYCFLTLRNSCLYTALYKYGTFACWHLLFQQ